MARTQHTTKTRAQRARAGGGSKGHGPSIKNGAVYEALVRHHMTKGMAAAISNAALNKGYAKGHHHGK